MTTTTRNDPATRRDGRGGSNGNRPSPSPAVSPPRQRVRVPELAVGLLITIVFALGAVLWHLSATTKTPVLATATSVERGEVIEAQDLRVVYLASDDPLVHLASSESAQVIGQVAIVDLAAGTLLTSTVIANGAAVDAGDGVIGLSLEPGQYPALDLAPGDRVNVIGSVDGPTSPDAGVGDMALVRGASVYAVEDLTSGRKLVSILMGETDAERVAAAAGAGGIRLVLVAP